MNPVQYEQILPIGTAPKKAYGKLLRHHAAGIDYRLIPAPLTTKTFNRRTISWTVREVGTIYFEWIGGLLYLRTDVLSEARRVPEWFFAVLKVVEGDADFSKPLYIMLPGRKRARKATPGETEYALIYHLRQQRKPWKVIAEILTLMFRPTTTVEAKKCGEEIARFWKEVMNRSAERVIPDDQMYPSDYAGMTVSNDPNGAPDVVGIKGFIFEKPVKLSRKQLELAEEREIEKAMADRDLERTEACAANC